MVDNEGHNCECGTVNWKGVRMEEGILVDVWECPVCGHQRTCPHSGAIDTVEGYDTG